MNQINLASDPYGVEESQVANRLRLAQMLQQQATDASQPIYSNRAALAKVLTGLIAGQQVKSAEKAQRDLADRKAGARKSEMDAIFEAIGGKQEAVPQPVKMDDEGNPMPSAGTMQGKPADRMALARLLSGSSDPQLAQAGLSLALKGPEKPEAYTLKPGEQRFEGGKVVASVPLEQKPEGPKKGELRKIIMGGDEVQQEWNGTGWQEVGRGGRWQPQQPDRTLVEVVDPTNPSRTMMVPREQAIGKAGPQTMAFGKAGREDIDGLRKEFAGLPVVKDFNTVKPIVEAARKAPDTPQGDFALIYGVGKVLDPNSVVREGEMNMVIAANSPAQRVQGYLAQLQGKGRLTPSMRKELQVILDQRAGEYEKGYNSARSTYEGIAKTRGYDPSQVFIGSPYLPQAAPGLSRNADGSFTYTPGG